MHYIAFTLLTLRDKLVAADKERGATAVEYGIMVAAIAVAIIVTVFFLGEQLDGLFQDVSDRIGNGGDPLPEEG